MYLKLYQEFSSLFKKTKFWENNYLFLREFKTFRKIAILALGFSFLGATFEGISIGFLLSFLQNITTVNATPIHTGIEWFDIWILGINTSAISRLYRISLLIILTTWLRVLFNYLGNLYS
jgi:ATP-binding cassette, subfamily B, bacterial MsbA